LETEESLRYLTEKQDEDNYVYYYDKSKNIQSQYITSVDNVHLLNVRKVYTNDIYFGIYFSTIDNQRGILHHLKCKDRSLGVLKTVEDKPTFIDEVSKFIKINKVRHSEKKTYTKQDFDLPFTVEYVYNDDSYAFCLITTDDNYYRGFYGNKPKDSNEILNFLESSKNAEQNNVITVSTSYSKILIEHRSQYEKSWSDIKRRNCYA
jgi:hypothetical protein